MAWDPPHSITFTRHSNTRVLHYISAAAVVIAFSSSLTWLLLSFIGVNTSPVSSKKLVVIDTDPGIDDALAILNTLGDSDVNVLGITCVRGNTDVPKVVVNALKSLIVANKLEIPVYTGYNFGLIHSPTSGDYFGSDGLGDLPFPNPPSPSLVQQEHAASFLARIVKEKPGLVTVLAIGPLTNLALALHLNPQFLQEARRIVILGGSVRGNGNVSPGVEFNFHMDPDAAALVLDRASETGTLLSIVPVEIAMDYDLTKEWRWKIFANIDNSVVSFLNKIEMKNSQMHPKSNYAPDDNFAAAVIICPEFVIHSQELYGYVENEGRRSRGSLMVDYRNTTGNAPNLEILMEVNTTVLKNRMVENFSSFK